MPDNVSYHGQKSGRSTVTPSAIDLGTHGTHSKNQVFVDSDHFVSSDDLKKTRSWSPRSDASDDLKTKRNYVAKLGKPGNQPTETRTHNELSKTSFDLNPDRTFKFRINSNQTKNTHNTDSAISKIDSSKKLNEAGDSGYTSRNAPDSGRSMSSLNSNTANQNNLKPSENLKNINSAGKTETKSKEAHSDSESETGTESSEDDLQPGNGNKMQEEHIWSISGRHIESNMAVTTNGHVNSFKSNDQSKVAVMPDDLSQYIISVPTGDGVKEVVSEATSSDDDDDEDTVPNKDDKTSDKKSTKKKGSKKTKWRKKKKTLVVPEHAENTEKAKSENKKPKSKAKKKKKRIIV